jgi:hypothetical protein
MNKARNRAEGASGVLTVDVGLGVDNDAVAEAVTGLPEPARSSENAAISRSALVIDAEIISCEANDGASAAVAHNYVRFYESCFNADAIRGLHYVRAAADTNFVGTRQLPREE